MRNKLFEEQILGSNKQVCSLRLNHVRATLQVPSNVPSANKE